MEPRADARADQSPSPERVRDMASAADDVGLGLEDLFVGCFARGSNFDRTDLEAMLLGLAAFGSHDYDLVALTINEIAAERRSEVRVRYSDEA
jgi:hypothetical protein